MPPKYYPSSGKGPHNPPFRPPGRKISFETMREDWDEAMAAASADKGHKRGPSLSNIEDESRLRRVKTEASLSRKQKQTQPEIKRTVSLQNRPGTWATNGEGPSTRFKKAPAPGLSRETEIVDLTAESSSPIKEEKPIRSRRNTKIDMKHIPAGGQNLSEKQRGKLPMGDPRGDPWNKRPSRSKTPDPVGIIYEEYSREDLAKARRRRSTSMLDGLNEETVYPVLGESDQNRPPLEDRSRLQGRDLKRGQDCRFPYDSGEEILVPNSQSPPKRAEKAVGKPSVPCTRILPQRYEADRKVNKYISGGYTGGSSSPEKRKLFVANSLSPRRLSDIAASNPSVPSTPSLRQRFLADRNAKKAISESYTGGSSPPEIYSQLMGNSFRSQEKSAASEIQSEHLPWHSSLSLDSLQLTEPREDAMEVDDNTQNSPTQTNEGWGTEQDWEFIWNIQSFDKDLAPPTLAPEQPPYNGPAITGGVYDRAPYTCDPKCKGVAFAVGGDPTNIKPIGQAFEQGATKYVGLGKYAYLMKEQTEEEKKSTARLQNGYQAWEGYNGTHPMDMNID
ncbi:hypothetical protein EDC01DRAFT_635165 [Geopyxis carbonaria]|nr:hypothetical protein EDC01DRAFT_635165 [Geopyxis carbonaria]